MRFNYYTMRSFKGYFLILGSVLSFAIMSSLVKSIPDVDSTITAFIRFSVGAGILGILALTKKIKLQFNYSPLLLLRGLTGGVAVYLLYLSIIKLGVGKATVYVYSYPIFATLFSVAFFKEKVKPIQWFFIIVAFAGVFMLSVKEGESMTQISIYELLAMGGALFSAISVVLVKKLHNTDSSYAIFFSQTIVGFWIFLFPANVSNHHGDLKISFILIGIGIVSAIGQLIMTEGYRYVSISKGSTMYMLVPVLNITIGYVVFNEIFSSRELIGASLVIVACVGLIASKGLNFRFYGPR